MSSGYVWWPLLPENWATSTYLPHLESFIRKLEYSSSNAAEYHLDLWCSKIAVGCLAVDWHNSELINNKSGMFTETHTHTLTHYIYSHSNLYMLYNISICRIYYTYIVHEVYSLFYVHIVVWPSTTDVTVQWKIEQPSKCFAATSCLP